jgi:hypothetical protein
MFLIYYFVWLATTRRFTSATAQKPKFDTRSRTNNGRWDAYSVAERVSAHREWSQDFTEVS